MRRIYSYQERDEEILATERVKKSIATEKDLKKFVAIEKEIR